MLSPEGLSGDSHWLEELTNPNPHVAPQRLRRSGCLSFLSTRSTEPVVAVAAQTAAEMLASTPAQPTVSLMPPLMPSASTVGGGSGRRQMLRWPQVRMPVFGFWMSMAKREDLRVSMSLLVSMANCRSRGASRLVEMGSTSGLLVATLNCGTASVSSVRALTSAGRAGTSSSHHRATVLARHITGPTGGTLLASTSLRRRGGWSTWHAKPPRRK
jgi:hypothetical protein